MGFKLFSMGLNPRYPANCDHGTFTSLLKQEVCTLQEKIKAELKCQIESMRYGHPLSAQFDIWTSGMHA